MARALDLPTEVWLSIWTIVYTLDARDQCMYFDLGPQVSEYPFEVASDFTICRALRPIQKAAFAHQLGICIEVADRNSKFAMYENTSFKDVFIWLQSHPSIVKHVQELHLDCWLDDVHEKNPGSLSGNNIMKAVSYFPTLHALSLMGRFIPLSPLQQPLPRTLHSLSISELSIDLDELHAALSERSSIKVLSLQRVVTSQRLTFSRPPLGLLELTLDTVDRTLRMELYKMCTSLKILKLPAIASLGESQELLFSPPSKSISSLHLGFSNREGEMDAAIIDDVAAFIESKNMPHLTELHLLPFIYWTDEYDTHASVVELLGSCERLERLFIDAPQAGVKDIMELLDEAFNESCFNHLKVLHFSEPLYEPTDWMIWPKTLRQAVLEMELVTATGRKWTNKLMKSLGHDSKDGPVKDDSEEGSGSDSESSVSVSDDEDTD